MDVIRDAVTEYSRKELENMSTEQLKKIIRRENPAYAKLETPVQSERKVQSTSFYIAARYGRKEEMVGIAEALLSLGHTVTSTWMYQPVEEMYENDPQKAGWGAQKDLDEIESADVLLYFSEKEDNKWGRGGRHVEFGYALGIRKSCWMVGPLENLFHYLPYIVQFEATESFFQYLTTA